MKITKFEHAFLQVEQSSQQLLIDPGIYSAELPALENVVGIVLTHQHDDHSYLPHIAAIKAQFPSAKIFGPADVAAKLGEIACEVVTHGSHVEVGEYKLDFFGDLHQEIHRSIPLVQNVGVLVNSKLYYPGDSYTQCDYPYELLACPSAAPWMKISDLIDFVEAAKKFSVVEFGRQFYLKTDKKVSWESQPQASFNKNFELIVANLSDNEKQGFTNIITAENEKQIDRLLGIFHELDPTLQVQSMLLGLREGFVDKQGKIVCYTDHQLFERFHKYKSRVKASKSKALTIW